MGDWYEIGVMVGVGVAAGIAFAGVLAGRRFGMIAGVLGAVGAGAVAGSFLAGWPGVAAGAVGAGVGAVAAGSVVRGAGRRGATAGGTALLLTCAAVVVGLLALVPLVGFLEAVVLPALAARRARRSPEKYAGLRSLAK